MSFLDRISEFFKDLVKHDDFYEATVVKGNSVWVIVEDRSNPNEPDAVIQRRVDEVRELNGLDQDAVIQPGQRLRIPLDWAK